MICKTCLFFPFICQLFTLPFFISTQHHNVLLIVVDDLRPSLGCYSGIFNEDNVWTPNIDQLAKHGFVFTKAFSQQALCGPSRTSFLTSRRPDTTLLYDVHSYWRKHAGNFTTLPQYFKEHGYYTASMGKIFHPGIVSNHSDDQPYSWSQTPFHPSSEKYKDAPLCNGPNGQLQSNIYCPVEVESMPEKTLPDIQTTDFAVSWLSERSKNPDQIQPFFLAVGYHKPHIPLTFPIEFLDLYPIDSIQLAPNRHKPPRLPDVAWNPWNDLRHREDIAALNCSFPFGPLPDYYARYIRQGYFAAITYIDSLIGKLLKTVQHHYPNTIVALIGDHGWSLGEHQEWSKYSNYEVATHIPFIIARNIQPSKVLKQRKKLRKSNTSDWCVKEKSMSQDGLQNALSGRHLKNILKKKNESDQDKKFSQKKAGLKFINNLVELTDLFPTLVDLAGLPALPSCWQDQNVLACTEGSSLVPLLRNENNHKFFQEKKMKFNKDSIDNSILAHNQSRIQIDKVRTKLNKNIVATKHIIQAMSQVKYRSRKVVLWQYPRPGLYPTQQPDSDQPVLREINVMGYTLRTDRLRYTAWVAFDPVQIKPNWDQVYEQELYDLVADPQENNNVFSLVNIAK